MYIDWLVYLSTGSFSKTLPTNIDGPTNAAEIPGSRKSLYLTRMLEYPDCCNFAVMNAFEKAISSGSRCTIARSAGYENMR